MRRVEVTDCGSCCRLAGICERMRNLEQGLLKAYGRAGKKLARKVSWLMGNSRCGDCKRAEESQNGKK